MVVALVLIWSEFLKYSLHKDICNNKKKYTFIKKKSKQLLFITLLLCARQRGTCLKCKDFMQEETPRRGQEI